MTLAAATVFPYPDGATEAGCEKQNIAVRTWKLIHAAHTDDSLAWRDMIHFEACLRRLHLAVMSKFFAMFVMTRRKRNRRSCLGHCFQTTPIGIEYLG